MGPYGEITKVLSYEAVDSKTGATLFASGKVGQGYQEVAFGKDDLIHDVERTKLLEALTPQIEQIREHVIPPLEKALEGDKAYGERAEAALRSNGYLRDK